VYIVDEAGRALHEPVAAQPEVRVSDHEADPSIVPAPASRDG